MPAAIAAPDFTAATEALPEPCLQAVGLGKRYQQASVFAGVDLTVRAGEFVAIVGESGVGKS
ncbi:MAG: hypothetical protein NTX37_01940, partial [Burkholderiales bacterium]|nr:hypothetical protein [Burkholderiales bacterium]